jgi:hypothetical protein
MAKGQEVAPSPQIAAIVDVPHVMNVGTDFAAILPEDTGAKGLLEQDPATQVLPAGRAVELAVPVGGPVRGAGMLDTAATVMRRLRTTGLCTQAGGHQRQRSG